MEIFKKLSQKLREKIRNKNSNVLEANEDGSGIANTERQRRKRILKKKVKSAVGVLLFCFLAIGGIYENITEVKATNFASKVVNIGGPITLEGNYTVTVWRSGNTVYCKAHVYVAAPNGAWSAMGAQVSANKGSASNTFVGNGSATPKAGSGDVQFSFTDAGAGTVSGTIYAGFMPNLNGSQALTASFSVNYSSNTVNTHTVTYDTNGGYYKEPYKNSEGRIIIPDGNYTLQHVWSKKNKNLNQYMTIKNGNMSSGTGMVITKNDPSSAQSQWTFERYKDTSYYYIINVKSGKAIGLNGYPQNGSLRDKAVEMYNQTLNEDDYLWYLREDGPGEYYIINKHTRQGLTARYTTVGDGNLIFQYGEGNDTSENTIYGDSTWYFNKVGEEVRTKAEGATFFTKSSIPVRTGYTFKYWSSSKDFATTWDGKNWDFNSTILDRAYIRAIGHNKYEVLAHTNGSIGEVSAPTWTMDGNQSDIVWYKLYPGTWERDGHTYNWGVQVTHKGEFAGTPLVTHFYSYYSNGSGQAAAREYGRVPRVFMSEGSYTYDQNGGNAILYANWYPKTVKTTFHRNFNSSDTTTAIHTYTAGAGQSFSTNGWSRQGYTLLGWSHSPNATTATYTPTNGIGDGWIEAYSSSTDLYAVWKKNSYQQTVRVRFENADGSFGEYSQAYQANHDYGSAFEWSYPETPIYQQSTKVSYTVTEAKSTDVTVYRRKYLLYIDGDEGVDGISGTGTFRYGTNASVTYRLKPGYKLVKITGTTQEGKQDGVWTGLAGKEGVIQDTWYVTCYREIQLHTELINYSISYNLNGGSMSGQASYNVNTATFTLPTPSKTGYTFTGWAGSNGSTPQTSVSINKGSTGNKSYTANWKANTYTVTYNPNKGSGSMSPDTVTYGTDYKTKKNTFTRAGYTFNGWNERADGTGTGWSLSSNGVYEANKTWTWSYTNNITLYAQWKANNYTYNIKYVSSSGKQLGSDTVTGTFDTSKTVTPPAKTGYTTPATQTVKFDSTSAKTITFTYPLIGYTISYDVNGGAALSGQRTSYNIESSAYTLPVPSRTGHTFTGWTGSNGTAPQKSVTITAGSTGNKSYKANWNVNKVSIAYNTSGGTINSSDYSINQWGYVQNKSNNPWFHVVTYGSTDDPYNASTFGLTRTGYTFVRWQNEKTGTNYDQDTKYDSTAYQGNSSSQTTANTSSVDCYIKAVWSLNNYSINYNLNGGSMSGQKTSYNVNTETFTLPTPTKTGYKFTGWTGSNGTTPQTSISISKGSTGNKSYTANWKVNTYTITYKPNGGSGSDQTQTVTYGTAWTTKGAIYSRTGYTMSSWNTQANGSGTKYTPNLGQTDKQLSNVTLYAQWTPNTYTITSKYFYYYQNNTWKQFDTKTEQRTYGSSFAPHNVNSPTGYHAGNNYGYYTEKSEYLGGGTVGTNNITVNQNIIVHVHYYPNTYTITYKPNGGSGTDQTQTATYGISWTSKDAIYSRTGYTQTSWNTQANGSGTKYSLNMGQTAEQLNNVTLYAQWTPNSYYLDLNGYLDGVGSGSISGYGTADIYVNGKLVADDVSDYCSQILYGSTYEIKDIKTKAGHVYNGVHSGKLSGTIGADRVNVYLSFSTKVITTTFHRNIGDSDTTTTTQNFKYGQSGQTFNANTWSRTGYTFVGWSTNKNATSMTYPDKCGVADSWIDSNYPSINLYAVWSLNTYSINYNLNGGSISGQKTSYNVNTDTFTLPMPTKKGYTFTGWTGSNGTTPQKNVTISKGSTGSKSYTANWSINSYTLTVNPNGGLWNGSSSSQNISQNYNTIKSIPVPTRTGYTFLRWDLKGSGTLNNRITSDPYFTSGMGGISTYNNNGDGKVALTRQTKSSDNTFGSNYEIKIDVKGANNPGYGGFYHGITSVANTKYVHSFIAKLPKGTTLAIAHNPVGDDYSKRWLTSNVGTGAWQVYAYEMNTGSKGTFSTFGHVYVSSSTTSAFTWYLAASQITTVSSNATYTYGAGNGALVAQWTPNRYTVTYNPNKGSGSMSSDTVSYGTAYQTKKNTFTRTGYTFTGWNEKSDGTGTAWSLSSSGVYEANKTWIWSYTHDINLYAQWTPNNYTYNIKYVSSSNKSLGSDTVTGTFDTSKTVTPPAKTGYTTPAAQTVKFDSTSAKTITFTYQLINYSISYDVNGGNALSGQRTSYNIESSAYVLPTPSKTGHTFTGWTGSNGTAPQKSVTIAAGSTGNKSYKANWSVNSYTNSISHWAGGFKNQEGNNSFKSWFALRTTTFNKNYGETFTMNDNLATAIPNGFYLIGKFGTSSLEGTWKTYEKPYSITQPAKEMSFEYDYYPYDYSITYNLDSGINNSANPSKYNVLYGVSLKNPTKTGYTFLGWYDNVNLIINKKYEIASDTTVNGNNYVFKNTTNGNTLNAFQIQTWKDGTYLETFAGGSQTGTRQEKYTHNRDTGNYTIRLKANGSTKDSSVYYYDVYLEKGKTYSISYNIEKCTSSEVVVKNLSFTRSDKVTGINEGANATFTSSDELYAKLKNRQTGNINLTAKWTPNEYTLTLNPNGGNIKGNINAQSLNPSLYYDRGNWGYVGSMSPSRAGYSFSGWFDAPSGGIKVYDSEGNCTNDGKYWKNKQYKYLGNLTVYAQWTPNSYTYNIKYVSSSNKSLGSDTVTGIFDTSKTVTPPDKTGYTTPAAQTVKFDSTSAKTITFIYQLINYSISYDVNGGTALSGQRTSYNIESSAYTLPVPSRIGYTFTGWTGSNGTTPQKSVTIAAGSTGNKSYKANWKANSLTIRYHSNGAFGGNKYENGSWTNNTVLDYEQSKDTVVSTDRYEEGTSNNNLKQYGLSDYDGKMNDHLYLYKNGYLGTGKYNTKPDGSGAVIDENKTFNSVIELANYLGKSINSNDNSIDLYPQWKAINYSIAYNGNGATAGSMAEQSATFDKNVELTSNNFSRKYTVTYNAMGGTVNAPNNVATSTFKGWEDRGNILFMDKNYTYNDFDAPYYSQNYTDLNAAFGFNKYSLIKHYFLYGKSEGRNPKDKTENAGLYPNKATVKNMTITNGYKVNLYANWKLGSVTLPTPTRFGYKFLGWYTSAEGGTKIAGATYTPTSNVTLYAHWKLDSYYIDYNVNDTGLTDRITDNLSDNNGSLPGKDTAVMLTDFALQNGSKYNTKYTFNEWNTKPDGSGQKFTTSITNDGSLCKPGETLTLYAIWDTTPTITGKDFYMLENMKPASDILTSGKGLDKNPIDHFPDNVKDVVYPVKGYTKNGTDISSRIKVDYVELDNSKTATASIDTNKPGKYTVHYSLTDGKQTKKFTRTITVLSASTPVINAGDRYFNKGSFVTAEMLLSTITSGDRYDGDLTNKVAVLNMEQIAFNTVGNYELQYKVTNRSGKTVVKKVKVHILEYLTDNQADKDNKYRYIRKDCSTKNDYCMEYFKEDSKWVTNDELSNQIIDSLSKDKPEEAIKKYHFSQDDVERSKQLQ